MQVSSALAFVFDIYELFGFEFTLASGAQKTRLGVEDIRRVRGNTGIGRGL